MTLASRYKLENLPVATIEDIRAIPGQRLTITPHDENWDKAFEARIAQLPETAGILSSLLDPSFASDRSNDEKLKKDYAALASDVERIGVFNASIRVSPEEQDAQKHRIKAIFMTIGPLFQEAYKRAEKNQEIAPVDIDTFVFSDRIIRFTNKR